MSTIRVYPTHYIKRTLANGDVAYLAGQHWLEPPYGQWVPLAEAFPYFNARVAAAIAFDISTAHDLEFILSGAERATYSVHRSIARLPLSAVA